MNTKTTLKELGLNDKEISVYYCLLKNGKASPSRISKITKINRTSVYHVAKGLQKLGIINEEITPKNTYFSPLPPKHLSLIIDRAQREIEAKKELVEKVINDLNVFSLKNDYPVPKIRFIDEENLEDFLIDNMPTWVDNMKKLDSTWWGTQDHTFSGNFRRFGDWYWSRDYAKKLNMFLISNNKPAEQEIAKKFNKYPNRDVRFNDDIDITSSVFIAGDYVLMIVTRQKPFYLFEIFDKTLAHNMREVFRNLWARSDRQK